MASSKWPLRRSQRIEFFLEEEVLKGFRSEELVEEALQILRATGHIHHFKRSQRGGELDLEGIDFLVWPEYSWIIPLQIKSSEIGRMEHMSEYGETVPCCVVVEPFTTISDLADKILKELSLDVRPLEEVLTETLYEIREEICRIREIFTA